MEKNTYTLSQYISAPLEVVEAYLASGDNLAEYTLNSRAQSRVNESTWLGTASGYQNGLYYEVRRRSFGSAAIVEWHCGTELGAYYHVYPMVLFPARYFDPASKEQGTYQQWVSFVDPARRTPMIAEGLPTVHRSEARSLKGHIERRLGHRAAVDGALELKAHTIYVDAPYEDAKLYLAQATNLTEWGFMLRRDGDVLCDEYGRSCDVRLTANDLGAYTVVEHDTRYRDSDALVRAPMLVIPAAYAFANADARGTILHRVTAWPQQAARKLGKTSPDDYDTEWINAKRILEAKAGNMATYARGCSYI